MQKAAFVFVTFLFFSCFSFAGEPSPFIHRDGSILRDSSGMNIKLRGINLGGWLLWEGWMWGDGFKSQSKLMDRLTELAGKEEVLQFRTDVFHSLMTEADIKAIASAGFNVVRIPFNHRLFRFEGDSISEQSEGWAILDTVMKWCTQNRLYAVLDMHAAPGGQSPFFIADHSPHELLWKSQKSREKTVLLWKAIARHYAGNASVAGYDLLNEPVPHHDHQLMDLYKEIIAAMRTVDKNHLVFLEGANFAKRFSIFKALPDPNMAFSFHVYTWLGADPARKVRRYAALVKELNVPVWCGEWGENNHEVILHTRKVLEEPSNAFCGWAYWSWKRTHTRYPNLNEIVPGTEWKKMMSWMKTRDHAYRTSPEETKAAMKDFLEACQFNRLKRDSEMLEILSGGLK
jgi:endoglucanase